MGGGAVLNMGFLLKDIKEKPKRKTKLSEEECSARRVDMLTQHYIEGIKMDHRRRR
jgi:hypothetical protein